MDAKEFEVLLTQAETRLKRLRALYEQYFQGIERAEPQNQRRDLDHMVSTLRRNQPNNTALRFRFTQVVQRYTTYGTYWRRITRQIEEGTYKRDVLRARRNLELPPDDDDFAESTDARELDGGQDVDAALDAVTRKSTPVPEAGRTSEITPFALPNDKPTNGAPMTGARSFPAPAGLRPKGAPSLPPPLPPNAAGKRPPPPPLPAGARGAAAASTGGMSDAELRQLHARYLEARKNNSERTDNVKVEAIAKSIQAMMPKLREKHAGKQIGFEVVVRDGKVALKPVAK